MERISKVLWGIGLVTVGLAALLQSREETPAPSSLLSATGTIQEVRENRGHYRFRTSGPEQWFAYTSFGYCENDSGLKAGSKVSILYKAVSSSANTRAFNIAYEIIGSDGPICSYSATDEGFERERKFTRLMSWFMLPLGAFAFLSAILHKTKPTPEPDLTLRSKRRGTRRRNILMASARA